MYNLFRNVLVHVIYSGVYNNCSENQACQSYKNCLINNIFRYHVNHNFWGRKNEMACVFFILPFNWLYSIYLGFRHLALMCSMYTFSYWLPEYSVKNCVKCPSLMFFFPPDWEYSSSGNQSILSGELSWKRKKKISRKWM